MDDDGSVTQRNFGGCVILTVPREVAARRTRSIDAPDEVEGQHVVVDLGEAHSVHSSVASALVDMERRIKARGGGMCIVSGRHDVRAKVNDAAAGNALPFYDEIGDALEASLSARTESGLN